MVTVPVWAYWLGQIVCVLVGMWLQWAITARKKRKVRGVMSEPQVSTHLFFRFGVVHAWYDLWVGLYWSSTKRRLYILPLPCIGIYVNFLKGGSK